MQPGSTLAGTIDAAPSSKFQLESALPKVKKIDLFSGDDEEEDGQDAFDIMEKLRNFKTIEAVHS